MTKKTWLIGGAVVALIALAGATFGIYSWISAPKGIATDSGIVPNTVGFAAHDAYQAFKKLEVSPTFLDEKQKAITIQATDDLAPLSGLFVCSQNVPAGAPMPPAGEITVTASATCAEKPNSMLVGKYAKDAGVWSPASNTGARWLDNATVEGWVFGFGDATTPQSIEIMTTYGIAAADLAMIKPITTWCTPDSSDDEKLASQAIAARDALLPIGTPVQLVLAAGPGKNDVFVHRLDAQGAPLDGALPANSVNELLITTGYWIPDIFGVEEADYATSPATHTWKVKEKAELTPLEETYSARLISAANSTRTKGEEPLKSCMTAQTKYWTETYLAYLNEANGTVSGDASLHIGKCWVNPYVRRGHWVSGYWRRC